MVVIHSLGLPNLFFIFKSSSFHLSIHLSVCSLFFISFRFFYEIYHITICIIVSPWCNCTQYFIKLPEKNWDVWINHKRWAYGIILIFKRPIVFKCTHISYFISRSTQPSLSTSHDSSLTTEFSRPITDRIEMVRKTTASL